MKYPYEGQVNSEKLGLEMKNYTQKHVVGDSSQSIPSVVLSDAVEKILKSPPIIHPKDPERDPYLINDIFLHMFISMMFCTGTMIVITASAILIMQYNNILLTEEILYLLSASCLIISGLMVLFSACIIALCTDCKLRSKQLANFRLSLKLVFITIIFLAGAITLAVKSRLRIKFDQNSVAVALSNAPHSSVMGEPIAFDENLIIKRYPNLKHKLSLNPSSVYYNQVKTILSQHMMLYNFSREGENYWDSVQKQLSCCGVEDPSDWLLFIPNVPDSCCINTVTTKSSCPIHDGGCLIRLAYMQSWYSSMMAGTGSIALVIMIGAFFLLLYMYGLEKKKPKIHSSSLSVKSQIDKWLNWTLTPALSPTESRTKSEPISLRYKQ